MTQSHSKVRSEIAQRVLSELPVAVIISDLNGTIIECNAQADKVLGRDEPIPELASLDDWMPRIGTLTGALRLVASSSNWMPLSLWRGEHQMELKGRGLLLEGQAAPHILLVESHLTPHRFVEHTEQVRQLNAQLSIQQDTEHRLRTALRLAEDLRRELVHRVKNNLAIVSALLRTKARTEEHPAATEALTAAADRIRSIAIVHDLLDARNQTDAVTSKDLFSTLLGYLRESICPPHITLEDEIFHTELSAELALPLSLLINELVTNAIKHAFIGRDSGHVRVTFTDASNGYQLVVADNGTGLPENARETGRGTRIIEALAQQLQGDLEVSQEGGTTWSITLVPCTKRDAPARVMSPLGDLATASES